MDTKKEIKILLPNNTTEIINLEKEELDWEIE